MVGPGTAEVRAEHQGTRAMLLVTVSPDTYPMLDVSIQGVVLPGTSQPMGRAMTHSALAVPATDVSAATTFTSSDTRVATVDGQRITFKPLVGNVVITGTHNGITGACGIAVYPRAY